MDGDGATFLIGDDRIWTYGDLEEFAAVWKPRLPKGGGPEPALLRLELNAMHAMGAAALVRLGIPFAALPSEPDVRLRQAVEREFPHAADLAGSLGDAWTEWEDGAGRRSTASQPFGFSDLTEPAFWLFTSGSTGEPKCVPVSPRQIRAAAEAARDVFMPRGGGAWLLALPPHHAGGLSVLMRSLHWRGAVRLPADRRADALAALLAQEPGVRTASLVAAQLTRILDAGGGAAVRNMQAVLLGGGPVPRGLFHRIQDQALPVWSGYGMSETFGMAAAADLREAEGPDRVGRAHPGIEVRLVGGEIRLRGEQLFEGYRRGGAVDRAAFTNRGWFRTGDIGELDEEGGLRVLARRTDLILTGGENVRPAVVEQALEALPGVAGAGVAGVHDPEWGQRVVGLVVWKGAEPWSDSVANRLIGELGARLKPHERPKRLLEVPALPLTGMGKIRRDALAEMAAAVSDTEGGPGASGSDTEGSDTENQSG